MPGTPYLAGSALEMHDAIGKTVMYSGVTLDDALRMASANPAELLGIADRMGSIVAGQRADLVLFDWNDDLKTLDVTATIVNGEVVYQNSGK